MENFNCDNIFENMPLALAYNKVIYDDNNEIKDFIVLKTNKSLEEVTGFKKEDVINKKGSNILKDIINNPIEFIQICGEVASNGKSKSLEVYSKITGNYYEVRIFSDKEGYFATVFSDITERLEEQFKLREREKELKGLYFTSQLVQNRDKTINEILSLLCCKTADFFEHPGEICVRITFAGEEYFSENFRETDCRMKSEIIVEGVKKGAIEVFDLDKKREDSENSFLKEERTLIQGISRILSNEFFRRETKKQLEQKSNILQSLTNKTPGAVYQYQLFPDGSSSFPYATEDIYEIYEVTPDEAKDNANKVFERIHPEDYERVVATIKESTKNLTVWEEEYRVKLPEKGIRWLEGYAEPEKKPDGSVLWHGNTRDITERKERENKLQEQQEKIIKQKDRMEDILEGTDAGTWEWNVQTGKTIFNEIWAKMIGYTLKEISPTTIETWKKFTHPDDLEKVEKMLEEHFNGEIDQYKAEIRMKHKKGHWVWMLDQGKVISWTEDGKPLRMFGIHMDITERKQREEKIKQLSFHDQLTGLYNRRYFEDTIERLNDSRILPIGVITADIDNFKSINDIYGHRVGDEYIKKTAEVLSNNVRNEDIVCRIGGDEFAIILPGIKSEIISNIENRIQNEIKEVEIKDCDFSISTGLEVKTDHKQDLEEIINKSDQKMYSMKELTKETALKKKLSIFKNKEKIVFEEFPMGIVISDLKGNIVEVNKQFCNMLGYSKEELKNMKHLDITKKEDNKINKKYMKKLKNKEIERFELDKKYIKKNGEYLDVKIKVEAIKDNYEKPVYNFGFVKEK